MKIYGIGTDIVNVDRVKKVLKNKNQVSVRGFRPPA